MDDYEVNEEKLIVFYEQRLIETGVGLIKLSSSQSYIKRLITNDGLIPFDNSLRFFIEQFR